jgi:lambda family phage portal protein
MPRRLDMAAIRADINAMVGGPLDAVRRLDRATALWSPPLVSSDRMVNAVKDETDARVRDLASGDAYVASGMGLQQDSIVGDVFTLNALPVAKVLGLDETWATEFQEEVEQKFTLWAQSPKNWPDVQRTKNFTDLIRLAVGVSALSGEFLFTTEWVREPGRPSRTCFCPIELERLSNPNGEADSQKMRRGVERDRNGKPIAYHIRKAHPSDFNEPEAFFWERIPAEKPWGRPMVSLIMEHRRPDQTRALSSLYSALSELQMMRKFRGIVLQNAIVNSTFAATIESELPSEVVFQSLGGGNAGDPGDVITEYGAAYLSAIDAYTKGSRHMQIDGVKIPHLYPGTKLKLQPASAGGPLGTDFEKSMLHYLAAILDLSYEELARDYTGANYTTMRAAVAQTGRAMRGKKVRVADRSGLIVYRCWLEEMINTGQISAWRKSINIYDGLNMEALTNAAFIGASTAQIDEMKETEAAVLRIANNLSTVEDEAGRLGKDWRRIMAQRKREIELEKKNDLPPSGVMSPSGNYPSDPANDPAKQPTSKPKQGDKNAKPQK